MNIIMGLESESWELEKREIEFLFPYLFRFDQKHALNLMNNKSLIGGELLIELKEYFEQALLHLLTDCYAEPPISLRQNHPTRIEKFTFKEKKYKVDYVTSMIGRLMYTLYVRIEFIDKAIRKDGKLQFSWMAKPD